MTEFRNTEKEIGEFRLRVGAAGIFVFVCFCLLLLRFIWLQGIKHEQYSSAAEDNRISVAPIVPNRGLILDRNGVVLARNYSAYTLEVTPSKLKAELDAVIDELAQLVDIQAKDRKRFKKLIEESKNFESLPIRTLLSDEEVARFSAQRFRFPGVDIRARLFRQYPLGETAAHVVGYIGRVSEKDQDRLEAASEANNAAGAKFDARRDITNYNGTDYIGKIGIEQSYETELHGLTGFEEVEVSAGGRAIRTLSTTQATPGNNLVLSIDVRLQQMVEALFGDRRGALVAIEPASGDILAFVSKPTFDPNLFVEGIDSANWNDLNNSPDKPLLNRPLRGTYPPGSTYKPFMALAALTTGKRTPNQAIADPGYFQFGNHTFRDDKPGGHGSVDLYKSVVHSCDTYYYILARDMGVNAMHDFMKPLGFGQITGIDIEGEARGILPSTDWKKKNYRKPEQQRWYEGETISLGIGQGYNSFTILQLAHATANLANNGVVMKPHLVKAIENALSRERTLTVPKESYRIPLQQEHIDIVKNAMVGVNKEGTGTQAFAGAGYVAAGKTGTAQVFTLGQNQKYNASQIAERLRDHALYMAFAPADKPTIALALIVENGGFGAQAAAPIARKVFDYYIEKKWPAELANLPGAPLPLNAQVLPAGASGISARPLGQTASTASAAQTRQVANSTAGASFASGTLLMASQAATQAAHASRTSPAVVHSASTPFNPAEMQAQALLHLRQRMHAAPPPTPSLPAHR